MNLSERVRELACTLNEPARVLVVEDDPADAELVRRTLSEQRCEVVVVADGESAVAMFSEHFDIIFLDLKLPKMEGTEVLRRAHEMLPNVPVVIITGYPHSGMAEAAAEIGFVELASKPLNREILLRIFNTHKIPTPCA